MKALAIFSIAGLIVGPFPLAPDKPSAPDRAPLLLVQEIPLPKWEAALTISRSTRNASVSSALRLATIPLKWSV